MSFYKIATPWNPGYSIPKYVLAEPPGRGTFTTEWAPRGTISQLIPDSLSGALGDSTIGSGPSLGKDAGSAGGNPITAYGQEAAAGVFKALARLPKAKRQEALKAVLREVDPSLWGKIRSNPTQANLAKAMSQGVVKEFVDLGTGRKKPKQAKQLSLAGCHTPTAGFWDAIKSTGGAVKDAISAVGGATCKLANNPLTPAAASGAALASGSPPQAGAAGVVVAQAVCASGSNPGQQQYAPPQPSMPGWVLPAAIGGGALLLIIALK